MAWTVLIRRWYPVVTWMILFFNKLQQILCYIGFIFWASPDSILISFNCHFAHMYGLMNWSSNRPLFVILSCSSLCCRFLYKLKTERELRFFSLQIWFCINYRVNHRLFILLPTTIISLSFQNHRTWMDQNTVIRKLLLSPLKLINSDFVCIFYLQV